MARTESSEAFPKLVNQDISRKKSQCWVTGQIRQLYLSHGSGLCWLVSRWLLNSHAVTAEAFAEVAASKGCEAGIDSWFSARFKGSRIKGVSAASLSGLDEET